MSIKEMMGSVSKEKSIMLLISKEGEDVVVRTRSRAVTVKVENKIQETGNVYFGEIYIVI